MDGGIAWDIQAWAYRNTSEICEWGWATYVIYVHELHTSQCSTRAVQYNTINIRDSTAQSITLYPIRRDGRAVTYQHIWSPVHKTIHTTHLHTPIFKCSCTRTTNQYTDNDSKQWKFQKMMWLIECFHASILVCPNKGDLFSEHFQTSLLKKFHKQCPAYCSHHFWKSITLKGLW